MKLKKSWTRADTQFLIGAILALLIWGLQLIGITVNLWLGTIVLAIAFVLMTSAAWVWERFSRWHVAWRIVTVTLAALLYATAVGWQIRSEWLKEHPSIAAKSPEPQKTPSQPAQPEVKPQAKSKTANKKSTPPTESNKTGDISTGDCSNVQIGGSGNTATTNCGPSTGNLKERAIALADRIESRMKRLQQQFPVPTTKAEIDQNFASQSVHFRMFLPEIRTIRDEFAKFDVVNEDLDRFLQVEDQRKNNNGLPRHILDSDITDVDGELREMASRLEK